MSVYSWYPVSVPRSAYPVTGILLYVFQKNYVLNVKCAQRRHKHCALAVVRPSQKKIRPAADPLPGGTRPPKFNQLETVATFTYRPSLLKIDARNLEILWSQIHKQTNTPTRKQTGPITKHCDAKLRAQCNNSVRRQPILVIFGWNETCEFHTVEYSYSFKMTSRKFKKKTCLQHVTSGSCLPSLTKIGSGLTELLKKRNKRGGCFWGTACTVKSTLVALRHFLASSLAVTQCFYHGSISTLS